VRIGYPPETDPHRTYPRRSPGEGEYWGWGVTVWGL